MRAVVTTALEVVGLVVVAVGAGLAWLPAGLVVAGASLVLVGFAEGRKA
jgi:hypothetical protein